MYQGKHEMDGSLFWVRASIAVAGAITKSKQFKKTTKDNREALKKGINNYAIVN